MLFVGGGLYVFHLVFASEASFQKVVLVFMCDKKPETFPCQLSNFKSTKKCEICENTPQNCLFPLNDLPTWKIISTVIAHNGVLSALCYSSYSPPSHLPRHAIPSAVQIIPLVSVWRAVILATAESEVGSELSQLFEPHRGWIEELFLALKLNDESGKKVSLARFSSRRRVKSRNHPFKRWSCIAAAAKKLMIICIHWNTSTHWWGEQVARLHLSDVCFTLLLVQRARGQPVLDQWYTSVWACQASGCIGQDKKHGFVLWTIHVGWRKWLRFPHINSVFINNKNRSLTFSFHNHFCPFHPLVFRPNVRFFVCAVSTESFFNTKFQWWIRHKI